MSIITHDTATFKEIYNEYWIIMFLFAQKFISTEDAQDIVGDVFANLWKSENEFNNKQALQTFLFRCVQNGCLNHKNKTQSFVEMPEIAEEQEFELDIEVKAKLLRAIETLPKKQREMIELHYIQGLSYKEICEKCKINYHTARSNVGSAIKALKLKIRR